MEILSNAQVLTNPKIYQNLPFKIYRWECGPSALVIAIILIIMGVLGFAASSVFSNSKVSATAMEMNGLGSTVTSYMFQINRGKPPASLKELPDVTEAQLTDAWGNEYEYVVPGPGNSPFDIISYGEDGQEGGTARAADIRFSDSD